MPAPPWPGVRRTRLRLGPVREPHHDRRGRRREQRHGGGLQGHGAHRRPGLLRYEEQRAHPPEHGRRGDERHPQADPHRTPGRHRRGDVPGRIVQQEGQAQGEGERGGPQEVEAGPRVEPEGERAAGSRRTAAPGRHRSPAPAGEGCARGDAGGRGPRCTGAPGRDTARGHPISAVTSRPIPPVTPLPPFPPFRRFPSFQHSPRPRRFQCSPYPRCPGRSPHPGRTCVVEHRHSPHVLTLSAPGSVAPALPGAGPPGPSSSWGT